VSDIEKSLDKMINITNEILIDQLTQQLAERDALILELSDKVDFYANWKSWDTTSHAYHEQYNGSIKADDSLVHYVENDGDKFSSYFGGKLARTPLKNQALLDKIKGKV
jgi:hypothetical protein